VKERVRARKGEKGGAHLHAESQSDCGAHRQLTRFVPSFLNRRHWDSVWKVKTDFSRFPAAPHRWRRARRISRPLLFLPSRLAGARLSYLKFQRRIVSFSPLCRAFPSKQHVVSSNIDFCVFITLFKPSCLSFSLSIERICISKQIFHVYQIIAHS